MSYFTFVKRATTEPNARRLQQSIFLVHWQLAMGRALRFKKRSKVKNHINGTGFSSGDQRRVFIYTFFPTRYAEHGSNGKRWWSWSYVH